ncbi:MAG: hypothetical protein VYA69_15735 [Gemmatimonadota bacterium]|nr:hypothetical protein [Gemmatimonadota bacterium]
MRCVEKVDSDIEAVVENQLGSWFVRMTPQVPEGRSLTMPDHMQVGLSQSNPI